MNITVDDNVLVGTETYHLNVTGQHEEAEKTEQKNTVGTNQYSAVSSQGDTLEISLAGKKASTELMEYGTGESSGEVSVSSENMTQISSTELSETEEADSISSTINLSSYSDSELEEMYRNGEITASEYQQEVARREQASEGTD